MIELPEALARAKELDEHIKGRTVAKVYPPSSPHKFCWYYGDVLKYGELLKGKTVQKAEGFGIYIEVVFDDDVKLDLNDGVKLRLLTPGSIHPQKYQLLIEFTDGFALVFTVAMYGGIVCLAGEYDNEYYIRSRESISPLDDAYDECMFEELAASVKPGMSLKALLATEQRIPGIGNGVLQDILYEAGLHPKRKVGTLDQFEKQRLLKSIKKVLGDMAGSGGRDTETDLFGQPGGYATHLSKNTLGKGCRRCGSDIIKENYMGGAIYYCPGCQQQPQDKKA